MVSYRTKKIMSMERNGTEQNKIKSKSRKEQNTNHFFSYLPWHGIANKRTSDNVIMITM